MLFHRPGTAYRQLRRTARALGSGLICGLLISAPAVAAQAHSASFAAEPALAPDCNQPLQSLVDIAAPNSTLLVPACVYRETVTVRKPLVVDGQRHAEIRGSDIWNSWTQTGQYWTAGPLVDLGTDAGGEGLAAHCDPTANGRCLKPEQVFFDGQPLVYDFDSALPASAGHFALNQYRTIVLYDDPTGHTVEVSTRKQWLVAQADNVTVEGFTMMHSASGVQQAAITNAGRNGWILQDNTLSDAHGAVVSMSGGNGGRILNNDIARGGQLAVHGTQTSNVLIQGNKIHDSNIDGFNVPWEAGGLKFMLSTGLTIDGNDAYRNQGPGLWCDLQCHDVTFSNNRTHDNTYAGVMFEISDGCKIFGNASWQNGSAMAVWAWGAGILVSSAANCEVYNNTVAWNANNGISIVSQANHDDVVPVGPIGNYVHDNNIIMAAADQVSLGWWQDWSGPMFSPASNNRATNNHYWYPSPENGWWRFMWGGGVSYLSEFSQTLGGIGSQYLTDAQQDEVLRTFSIPAAPNTAAASGPN
jgi:parallel beta-helix repeat protein